MAVLQKEDLDKAMREIPELVAKSVAAVLLDKAIMQPVLHEACVVTTRGVITEAFGFDPTDPKARVEVLQDMVWVRESRIGISLKEAEDDHVFVRKFRNTISQAVWRVGYVVVMTLIALAIYAAGFGWKTELLK